MVVEDRFIQLRFKLRAENQASIEKFLEEVTVRIREPGKRMANQCGVEIIAQDRIAGWLHGQELENRSG